jgi:predicted DNA-binding transcriptional regulator AlpA
MIEIGAPGKINIPAEIYIISLSAVQENESNGKYEVNTERYVDVKRVSRYTSLPVKTIYDWSNQGKFPCMKYGRRILFDLQDVD